jgi:hypothetical protein
MERLVYGVRDPVSDTRRRSRRRKQPIRCSHQIGIPASAMVGTLGRSAARLPCATANALHLPLLDLRQHGRCDRKVRLTRPEMRSAAIWALPGIEHMHDVHARAG